MKDLTEKPPPVLQKFKKKKIKRVSEKPVYDPIFYKPVSVSFVEKVPLKSILQELSKSLGIDLQLDSNITLPLYFQATKRPFIEIIEDLSEMADLRFSIKHKRIRIERDLPYTKTYSIQFLNLTRSSQNRISITTNIFSGQSNGGDTIQSLDKSSSSKTSSSAPSSQIHQDSGNGSDSQLNVSTNHDFFKELETNLNLILENNENVKIANKKDQKKPYFSIHKHGGLLTVFANAKTHERLVNYLEQLKETASSQVLIEAKIIEVHLNHEFQSGINWSKLNSDLYIDGRFGTMASSSRFSSPNQNGNSLVSIGSKSINFSSILQMLEEFGHARTLSSPRLTVMNNQAAILKVAKNEVYFRLNYDKYYMNNANSDTSSFVSSTVQTVPIGLIMAVQPSIDMETGEVILFLRPTISKFNKTVSDPAVSYINKTSSGDGTPLTPSNVPVVEVREIDSVMKLKDGEIGILGGLMEISTFEETNGVPGFDQMPILKDLFSSQNKGDRVVELVILLKVTIAKSDHPTLDGADERLRKDYMADPRQWS